ncbi:YiiX/YebB-like N1pC/P60 family cysteine hydrolase [Catalinimonas sp. 4WD22]
MYKLLLSCLLSLSIINFSCGQSSYQPKAGDLLFQDLDCGPYCESIEKVTEGVEGADFSHMGIVVLQDDKPFVYEAVSKGVLATPLEDFLQRNTNNEGQPKVMVGRLTSAHHPLIPEALKQAENLLGNAYDEIYVDGDEAYYCSELIYEIFKRANQGKPLFPLAPMTYIDPDTGETFPIWEDYFDERGTKVPEGVPGINPGAISRSPYLDIVYQFYQPKSSDDL